MTRQSDGRSGHDKQTDSRSNTSLTLRKACRLVKEHVSFRRTSDARNLLVEALRSDRVYSYGRPKLFHRPVSKMPYPLAPGVWQYLEIDAVQGMLYSRKSQLLVVPTRPKLTVLERRRGRKGYSDLETKVEWIADVRIDLPSLTAFLDKWPRPPTPKPPRFRILAEKDNPAIRGSSDPEFVQSDETSTEQVQEIAASVEQTQPAAPGGPSKTRTKRSAPKADAVKAFVNQKYPGGKPDTVSYKEIVRELEKEKFFKVDERTVRRALGHK